MSLTITNISIQLLTIKPESGEVIVKTGEHAIATTPKLTAFVESLHQIYNSKGSKAYARFVESEEPSDHKSFEMLLIDYLNQEQNFTDFSKSAANLLIQEIVKYDIAESGYLVFVHYEMLGGRYLLATLLPVSQHFYVDGELNISADEHIDTAKVQLAARLDLFEYKDNRQGDRYISFIKGRAGRKVADFFLEFLGCEEGVDAKKQSQNLVSALEDFVNIQQLDADEKQATRKDVVSYCKEQQSAGLDVRLQDLSQSMPSSDNGQDFYNFCKSQSYDIEETFPVETSVINKATKFSGYGGGISISFERSHLGRDIIYNHHNETLVINRIPPNLKDQLLKLLNEE